MDPKEESVAISEKRKRSEELSRLCRPRISLENDISDISYLYRVIKETTGDLGGNGSPGSSMYGELRKGSMDQIVDFMVSKCELSRQSRFIDIGSGLGKPSFHVACRVECELSYGIENAFIRQHLCMMNLIAVLSEETITSMIGFQLCDALELTNIEPFTHVFQFDLAFPPNLLYNIADAFNASRTAKYLICFHKEDAVLEYGFRVRFLAQCMTHLSGSNEGHTCYFYVKEDVDANIVTPVHFAASLDQCHIDPIFKTSIDKYKLENWSTSVIENAKNDIAGFLNGGRPVRNRRPSSTNSY